MLRAVCSLSMRAVLFFVSSCNSDEVYCSFLSFCSRADSCRLLMCRFCCSLCSCLLFSSLASRSISSSSLTLSVSVSFSFSRSILSSSVVSASYLYWCSYCCSCVMVWLCAFMVWLSAVMVSLSEACLSVCSICSVSKYSC